MLRESNKVKVFGILVYYLDPNNQVSLESKIRRSRGKKARAQQWGKGGTRWHAEDPKPLGHQGGDSFPFWFQQLLTWPDCSAAEPSKSEKSISPGQSPSCNWLSSLWAALEDSWSVLDWNRKWASCNFLPRKASGTQKPLPRLSLLTAGSCLSFPPRFHFLIPSCNYDLHLNPL